MICRFSERERFEPVVSSVVRLTSWRVSVRALSSFLERLHAAASAHLHLPQSLLSVRVDTRET